MKKLGLFFSVIILLSVQSCGKEEDFLPEVLFTYQGSLLNELSSLQASAGVVVLPRSSGGVAGLVLYKTYSGRIVAYDRCSTVNPEQLNAVTWVQGSNLVEDKASGSLFLLEDGSAYKAPASRPLKEYRVSINGNILTVSN
ncbi:MAG TPA: hypothetical protein VF273_05340 [Pelobium sp.]